MRIQQTTFSPHTPVRIDFGVSHLSCLSPANMFPIGNLLVDIKSPNAIFPIRNMKTINNSTELGAIIREERKRLKVTQKELAMVAGTGLRFLIELERGKPTSRIEGVFKVLQALGIKFAIVTSGAAERTTSS